VAPLWLMRLHPRRRATGWGRDDERAFGAVATSTPE
jgi:hypothetical protein